MLLSLSVFQIVYLEKVPEYAIINEAVEIAKKRGHKGDHFVCKWSFEKCCS